MDEMYSLDLKACLDLRICDVETITENTETYREFIKDSCKNFGVDLPDLDSMDNAQLNEFLNFVDNLWQK